MVQLQMASGNSKWDYRNYCNMDIVNFQEPIRQMVVCCGTPTYARPGVALVIASPGRHQELRPAGPYLLRIWYVILTHSGMCWMRLHSEFST